MIKSKEYSSIPLTITDKIQVEKKMKAIVLASILLIGTLTLLLSFILFVLSFSQNKGLFGKFVFNFSITIPLLILLFSSLPFLADFFIHKNTNSSSS